MDENKRVLSAIKDRLVKDYGYSASLIGENYHLPEDAYAPVADLVVFESSKKDKILIVIKTKRHKFAIPLASAQIQECMKLTGAAFGLVTNLDEELVFERVDGAFLQIGDIPSLSTPKPELKPIPNPSDFILQLLWQSRNYSFSAKFYYELLKILVSKYADENNPDSSNPLKKLSNNDQKNYLLLQSIWKHARHKYPILKDGEIRIEPKLATRIIRMLKDFSLSRSNTHEIISTILAYSRTKNPLLDPHNDIIEFLISIADIKPKESLLIPFSGQGNVVLKLSEKLKAENHKKLVVVERQPELADMSNMITILLGKEPTTIIDDPLNYQAGKQYDKLILFIPPFGLKTKRISGLPTSDYTGNMIFRLSRNIKTGGRLIAVLPQIYLSDSRYQRLRELLLEEFHLLAVIKPAWRIFFPHTAADTSIVMLERKPHSQETNSHDDNYNIFVAEVNEEQLTKSLSSFRFFQKHDVVQSHDKIGFLTTRGEMQEDWNVMSLELKKKLSALKNPTRLSDVAEILPGMPFSFLSKTGTGLKVPYLRMIDLKDKLIQDEISTRVPMSKPMLKKYSKYQIKPNDVIVPRHSAVEKLAIVTSKHDGALLGQQLFAVRPTKKILSEYLLHAFAFDSTQTQIRQMTRGSISAALSRNSLKALVIPLPSLSEQKKIVKKFSGYLAQIQSLEEELQHLRSQIIKT